jgi:hypothetical protein
MQVRYQAALHADKPCIIAGYLDDSVLNTQKLANFQQFASHPHPFST